jgi:hypothetical protein
MTESPPTTFLLGEAWGLGEEDAPQGDEPV